MTGQLLILTLCTLGGLMLPVAGTALGDDPPPQRLADWIQADLPVPGTSAHSSATHDQRSWVVTWASNEAVASPLPENRTINPLPPFAAELAAKGDNLFRGSKTRWTTRAVTDGWLVGANSGEFGGAIWWLNHDGSARYRIANQINPVAFVSTDQGLLLLEGLTHLGLNQGRILQLVRESDTWKIQPFVESLDDAPRAATLLDPKSLLIVGFNRLLRVDLATRRVEPLIHQAFWDGLYPTSIVVAPEGLVWIGMRHGVARLDGLKPNPTIRWYLPNRATDAERAKPGFQCRSASTL